MRDESSKRGYKGYCIDLLDAVGKRANFNYTITEVDEHGQMDENGVWNGVVRKLIDKEADIGLGTMHVMAERETVIDFTVPYYDLVGITVLMMLPRTKNSLFKFLTVLETDVWFCILGAYFFTRFKVLFLKYLNLVSFQLFHFFLVFLCTFLTDGVHIATKIIKKNMQTMMKNANLPCENVYGFA